jgi:hypothetical protein
MGVQKKKINERKNKTNFEIMEKKEIYQKENY